MNSSTYPAAQHVMVLYTGGTIGMQASANGLAPASGFEARMREYLHSQPELVVPQWRFREMSPLIDSANMTPAYWQQLREAVVDAVDVQGCDSVLILHGTDTLAYSAAAEVLPGVAIGDTGRQHGTGKTHAGMQAEQLKTHGRRAVARVSVPCRISTLSQPWTSTASTTASRSCCQ